MLSSKFSSRQFAIVYAPLTALSLILTACGGGGGGSGSYGSHHTAPNVYATVVGAGAAAAGNTFTVRSGGVVTLSGKDSEGVDAPVLTFDWKQISPATPEIALAERNSSTRVFVAPTVTSETTFVFELTGTDANGLTNKQQVTIKVEPILDANAFLTQPDRSEALKVRVKRAGTADCSLAPPGGSAIAPFTLQLTEIVTWKDRVDATLARGPAAPWQKTISGQIDANQACTDISVPMPAIVVDDINAPLEKANRRSEVLELYRMDTVQASVQFDLTSGSSAALTANLTNSGSDISPTTTTLTNPNASGSASYSVQYDLQSMRSLMGLPNAQTGANYYSALDPAGDYATLAKWLQHAGFTDSTGNLINDASIAKAIYTNNYDLGFGREMYLRKAADGSVYSYVVNYPSLENAIQGSNSFAVVAMEYSGYASGTPSGCATDKFVKFFAFVPDQVNGGFKRMPTMNFDGRGEKAVPGVCTSCHGGTLEPTDFAGINSTSQCGNADIGASFMPWDMDALLYSDTDPSLNKTRFTDAQWSQYTRSAQQTQIRKLNEGALATYIANPSRYDASIRLIHGWYGERDADDGTAANYAAADQLPAADFDGSYVQSGWRSQAALYHDVFASNCRACHTQMAPTTLTNQPLNKNFTSYTKFSSYFPSASNPSMVDYVFKQGLMPFARLTMDRFWVSFNSGESAAEKLRAHINQSGLNTISTNAIPGHPVASFTSALTTVNSLATLDSSKSVFADTVSWSILAPDNSVVVPASSSAPITTFSAYLNQSGYLATGPYTVSLTVSNAFGSDTTTNSTVAFTNQLPVTKNCTLTLNTGEQSGSIPVLSNCLSNIGDGLNSLTVVSLSSSATSAESASASGNTITYTNTDSPYTTINSPGLINYRYIDKTGDTVTGSIDVLRDPAAPPSITSLTATGTTTTSITWNAVGAGFALDHYEVYRNGSTLICTRTPPAALSCSDSGLTSNVQYNYQVVAVDGASNTLSSSPQTVRTPYSKAQLMNDIVPPCNDCHTGLSTRLDDLKAGTPALSCLLYDGTVAHPTECGSGMGGPYQTEHDLIQLWINDGGLN